MSFPRKRFQRVKAAMLFVALLAFATPSSAEKICQHYGPCTICDFYGPNGEYAGSIEWCF